MSSSISGVSGGFSAASLKQMQEKMFKSMDSNNDGKVDKNELSTFQKAQQADGKRGGPSIDEIFKKSDSNSDGGITLQEMQDSMAKIAQQMMQSQTPPPASGGTESNLSSDLKDKVFKSGDQNGDGSISKDELSKLLSNSSRSNTTADDLMSALDTNKDGSISKSESDAAVDKAGQQRHAQGPPPPPPPADNSSSASEKTSSNQIFDALDTNKDGTVSANELLAAFSSKESNSSDNSSSDTSSSSSSSADSSAVKKIFDAMDTNQDGSVSKSELEAALAKKGQHHHSESTADSSSTTATTDSANTSDSALFAAAAKSYMQASFSSFSQNAATSALTASSLYA